MTQNTRQLLMGGGAVVILGIAALVFFSRSAGTKAPSETFTLDGICLNCKVPVVATYHASERQPAICPKCNKRAVYDSFVCEQCKLRFVPRLEDAGDGGPPKMPIIATCPKCGGMRNEGFIAKDPEHQATTLAPLPPWKG